MSPSRRTRWAVVFLVLVLAAGLAWQIAEWLIDIDRYRTQVEAQISQAIGLPASVGRLDLDILPTPRFEATGVSLGGGDFRLDVPRVVVHADFRDLIHRKIHVTEITLLHATVTVPEDAMLLADRLAALGPPDDVQKAPGAQGAFTVDRIRATGVLRRGTGSPASEDAPPWLTFDMTVQHPLAEAAEVSVSARLPGLGDGSELDAQLRVTARAEPAIQGRATLRGVNARKLFRNAESIPEATVSLEIGIDTPKPNVVAFDVTGQAEASEKEAPAARFAGKAWWGDGGVVVNDFTWRSPGLEFVGNLTRSTAGSYACEAPWVMVREPALTWLAGFLPSSRLALVFGKDASLEGEGMLFGLGRPGTFGWCGVR